MIVAGVSRLQATRAIGEAEPAAGSASAAKTNAVANLNRIVTRSRTWVPASIDVPDSAIWPTARVRSRVAGVLRRALTLLGSGLIVLVLAQTASASGGRVCGSIRASVPYSRHGNAERWRVYVSGAVSCQAAEATLAAVMHLDAAQHNGASEASSYFTVGSWRCPFGDMGFQTCAQPARAPHRAQALAVECSVNACPSGRAPSYFR
jgi:hypothetical protein